MVLSANWISCCIQIVSLFGFVFSMENPAKGIEVVIKPHAENFNINGTDVDLDGLRKNLGAYFRGVIVRTREDTKVLVASTSILIITPESTEFKNLIPLLIELEKTVPYGNLSLSTSNGLEVFQLAIPIRSTNPVVVYNGKEWQSFLETEAVGLDVRNGRVIGANRIVKGAKVCLLIDPSTNVKHFVSAAKSCREAKADHYCRISQRAMPDIINNSAWTGVIEVPLSIRNKE